MIGKIVSHYRILEKLGGGGMGVVYKAKDTKLNRFVALKFLPPHLNLDSDAERDLISEAKAASAFDHPNICTIYEIDKTTDNQLFISMACYEGETLKKKLKNGPLSLALVLDYVTQIANGLDQAHKKGIIHRDVKPANIFITNDGIIKILDFGLAKETSQTDATVIGAISGTIAYMSPEQIKGQQNNLSTDIWSLGVVVYQMLTGELPFKGDYEQAIVYSILNEHPEPITKFVEKCPLEIADFTNKLLEKDPANRYSSIEMLLNDLKVLKNAKSNGFNSESKNKNPLKKKYHIKKSIALASLFIMLIVSSLFIQPQWQQIKTALGISSPSDELHVLILPFTNIGGDSDKQAFCDGLMETLSSKLTQLEKVKRSLWVVPASEVIRNKINSPDEAQRAFGVNLAVTGSLQFMNDLYRLTLNLVDAVHLRQVSSAVIDIKAPNISGLQDKSVIKLLEMLHVELNPELSDVIQEGTTSNPEAYEYYVQARGYLQRYENNENIDNAINSFKHSINSDTLYAVAFAGLGESYWRKYEFTKDTKFAEMAIQKCEYAFQLDSFLVPVNVTLGMIYAGTGRNDLALKQYNRALSNDPSNAAALRGLAKTNESLKNYDQAESIFKKAIKTKPLYWAGYNDLGVFYYKNGEYKKAIDPFKMVIKLTPDNYRGYNNLGGIYYMLEKWTAAREMFEKSLTIKKSYKIYSNLGTLYYIEGKFRSASHAYEAALKINSKDYLTWGNLAAAYFELVEKKDKAIQTYMQAIKIGEKQLKVNPNDYDIISNIASYYADIGNKSKSLDLLQKSLKMAPDDVQVNYRAATIYEQLGDRDQAVFWIARAIKNGYSISDIENQPELKNLTADQRYLNLKYDVEKQSKY